MKSKLLDIHILVEVPDDPINNFIPEKQADMLDDALLLLLDGVTSPFGNDSMRYMVTTCWKDVEDD